MCVGGPSRWHVVVGGVTTDPALKSQEGGGGGGPESRSSTLGRHGRTCSHFCVAAQNCTFFFLYFFRRVGEGLGRGRGLGSLFLYDARACVCACLVWRPQFGDLLCVAAVVREKKHLAPECNSWTLANWKNADQSQTQTGRMCQQGGGKGGVWGGGCLCFRARLPARWEATSLSSHGAARGQ